MSDQRRGDFLLPLLYVLTDALAIEAAFLLAYWLRFATTLFSTFGFLDDTAPPFRSYLYSSWAVLAMWLLLFEARRMYAARRSVALADEFVNVIKVVSLGMLIVMSVAFLYRTFSYSRLVFALLWVLSLTLIFSGRVLLSGFERSLYRRGRHLQQAVIIGNDVLANTVFGKLHRHPSFGFMIAGYFSASPADSSSPLAAAQHLGPVADAPAFLRDRKIDLAFVALQSSEHQTMFDLVTECEGLNVRFMMVPDVLQVLTSQMRVREIEGIPFLEIKGLPFTTWGRITKRTFDLAVSGMTLLVLSPLLALVALLIKLDSRGPMFFRQQRVGLDGKPFTMYKFRSMVEGADRSDAKAGLGIKGDPRRTRLGRFLRKASLDELPQLFNVLRGEMSLVGPRPERVRFVQQFGASVPKYLDRHRVKTGLTGWAQVNGLRGNTSIEDRVKYDLYYIENWSLVFDVKILLRTVRAALSFKEVD
jgi:Undecaprenyl-phosphate glucose phosphotransferase